MKKIAVLIIVVLLLVSISPTKAQDQELIQVIQAWNVYPIKAANNHCVDDPDWHHPSMACNNWGWSVGAIVNHFEIQYLSNGMQNHIEYGKIDILVDDVKQISIDQSPCKIEDPLSACSGTIDPKTFSMDVPAGYHKITIQAQDPYWGPINLIKLSFSIPHAVFLPTIIH
jgi:hypothetical protein